MERKITYRIQDGDLPATVKQILKKCLQLTEHQIRSAKYRRDGICLNGVQVRVTAETHAGDEVCVMIEEAEARSERVAVSQSQRALEILYEDEDLLVVNKAAGIAVHPGHGHYRDTLANDVQSYLSGKNEETRIRSIGRLDKETSGIVVFAKNQIAAQRLSGSGRLKETSPIQKEYWALVHGVPAERNSWIDLPIGKEEGALNRMCISASGKEARTCYQVLREYEGYSLLSLRLATGRTHQIRVHMAAMGHPLLGDRIYGEPASEKTGVITGITRAALHCRCAVIRQPFTGERIRVEAPVPKDMADRMG